jgi:hypothetical protein
VPSSLSTGVAFPLDPYYTDGARGGLICRLALGLSDASRSASNPRCTMDRMLFRKSSSLCETQAGDLPHLLKISAPLIPRWLVLVMPKAKELDIA